MGSLRKVMASPQVHEVFNVLQGLSEHELFEVVDAALASQPQARKEILHTWELQPNHLNPTSIEYFGRSHGRSHGSETFDSSMLHIPSRQQQVGLLQAMRRNDVLSVCELFPPLSNRVGAWGLQLDFSGHRLGSTAMRCLAEALRRSRPLL